MSTPFAIALMLSTRFRIHAHFPLIKLWHHRCLDSAFMMEPRLRHAGRTPKKGTYMFGLTDRRAAAGIDFTGQQRLPAQTPLARADAPKSPVPSFLRRIEVGAGLPRHCRVQVSGPPFLRHARQSSGVSRSRVARSPRNCTKVIVSSFRTARPPSSPVSLAN